ncbi:hypothetical protein LSM04_000159 [Trypanosoma melophagium]|uniref:uncharacterized protein n=1 Tax=Trypanosoma melophagium TaxID=715481 RepID=UPI00351A17BF|nr:hypothetical protein LSM04_000159 [Trypanosoma melophagium]
MVTAPGPWVFTASHDHRILQWHAETHEVIRDITNICCIQDDYRCATRRVMTVAMGCSINTSFTHPRGHFIFFFATKRRVPYSVSLGGPARRENGLADTELPLQRITSALPTVTSAVALVGSGDDEGSITLTPLTVVYNSGDSNREENTSTSSSAAAAFSTTRNRRSTTFISNSTNTNNTTTLSDGKYLRRVSDAVLTADTLHVNKGRITALSLLPVRTDKTTGIMSYCLAAASFKNAITLFTVSVSPVIAGGHISGCSLLSVLPTVSPVTSLAPLFAPVRQFTVAIALMSFADGIAAVLFHFLSSITHRKDYHRTQSNKNTKEEEETTTATATEGISIDLNGPRAATSTRMKNVQRKSNNNNNVELQERLRMALQVVSDASTVAEETEETLEEQRQELQQLRTAKEVLTITLKQQNDDHHHNHDTKEERTIAVENAKKVRELEQRNRILAQQLEK